VGPGLIQITDNSTVHRDKEEIKDEIDSYMLLDFGVALFIFICFCVHFPSKPDLPPTPTSTIVRTEFKKGIKEMLTNKDVLLLCFAYSISIGVMGAWMSVLVLNLRPLDISDQEVGYIGLATVLGQCVASIGTGYISDLLRHKIKKTLFGLQTLAAICFSVVTLMCLKVVPSTLILISVVLVAASSLNAACCPLFFELCVELAYPVSENLVAVFLTTMNNFVGNLFLFCFFIPNIGSLWINYVLIGSTIFSIPAILLVKERYNRSSVDEMVTQ